MVANFRQKRNKKDPKKQMLLFTGAALVLSAIFFLAFTGVRIYLKKQRLENQLEGLKTKIEDLSNKNEELRDGIAKKNDDAYIEKTARESLDLQKPGEKVYSFIRTTEQQQETNEDIESANGWLGWIGGAWSWIKTNF